MAITKLLTRDGARLEIEVPDGLRPGETVELEVVGQQGDRLRLRTTGGPLAFVRALPPEEPKP